MLRDVQRAQRERGAPVHLLDAIAGRELPDVAGLDPLAEGGRPVVADRRLRVQRTREAPAACAAMMGVRAMSPHDDGQRAMLLASRAYRNLDVLAERGEELHELLDRNTPRSVPHQRRDVRLLDAEDFTGLHLGEAASLK
jgi:hypothetical protein